MSLSLTTVGTAPSPGKRTRVGANLYDANSIVPGRQTHPAQQRVRSLYHAILERALEDYQTHVLAQSTQPTRFEVERWFQSKDRAWPFSFENICDVLEVSPDWIRRRLPQMPPRKLQAVSHITRIVAALRAVGGEAAIDVIASKAGCRKNAVSVAVTQEQLQFGDQARVVRVAWARFRLGTGAA